MAPTVVREGSYRLFFFSREELRMHVHVAHPDGEAKFWLEPTIRLAVRFGLTDHQVKHAECIVRSHEREIRDAWRKRFDH